MSGTNIHPAPRIRVAICGGGIGGLCLAVALATHARVDVALYEAAGQFREIGAGVMIYERTWHALEKMGLARAFSAVAHAPPTGEKGVVFDFRRSDQPREGKRFKLVERPYGCIRFHRAAFLDVLVAPLPAGIANFGKRLASYARARGEDGPITLAFTDGSTSACDVLVGADGVKSVVRTQMYRAAAEATGDFTLLRYLEPVWTGTMAYRGLIDVRDVPRNADGTQHRTIGTPMMYCGKGRHVVSYSISQGDIVNVVAITSEPEKRGQAFEGEWVTNCEQQELVNSFAGWEPEVESLLQCIKNPTKWAIHEIRPLPFYHQKGVVLLGDAAHAMAPHQGAGAGQAIEDAFILAQLLSEATLENAHAYLDAYQTIRHPFANGVLAGSYESGLMYEFNSKYGDNYETLGPAIQAQWAWIDKVSLEEELASAMTLARRLARGSRM